MFKRRAKPLPPGTPLGIRDPLAVVPVQPATVERKEDSQGHVHLRLNAPPRGIVKFVAKWLHYDYSRKLQLDEYGSFFYNMVDGATPLKTIVAKMTKKIGGNPEEVEKSVILFAKKLMVMNMLVLEIPESALLRSPNEQS